VTPDNLVPLVREPELLLSREIQGRLTEFMHPAGVTFISIYPRPSKDGIKMDVMLGHRGEHTDREVADVAQVFIRTTWPELVVSVSARAGADLR
jgi:hypothetical protein